ncbi:LysR family transcriptional regulator [Azospirillum sp. sgz302134]
MFDWDDLRHFTALADDGSLSAAARRLKVEHATVARRIAALEEAMGVKLVDRRRGRYVLTPDGERVAGHARRMQAEAMDIERVLRAGRDDADIELSVNGPPLTLTQLIAPRLPMLRQSHPRIRLRLMGESRTVSLVRGEADIVLRMSRPTDTTLVARRVGTMTYKLYASRGYLASRRPEEFEFISFDESLDTAPHHVWLRSMAGERPFVLRSNDLGIQCAAAQAGVGVAALPTFVGEAAGLERVDPADRLHTRDIWIAFHRDLRDSPAIAAVVAFLADCVRLARVPADQASPGGS